MCMCGRTPCRYPYDTVLFAGLRAASGRFEGFALNGIDRERERALCVFLNKR